MNAGNSFISDGRATVSHVEVRAAIPAWDDWLRKQGVSPRSCVVLSMDGGVRSAVVLIALLSRGQSVFLSRQPFTTGASQLSPGALPGFCRAILLQPEAETCDERLPMGPQGFRVIPCNEGSAPPHGLESAYVYIPSSGTTGSPKIAAYEPDKLLANARNCVGRLQLSGADHVVIPVPLAHMYGLGAAFLPAFLTGANVRLVSEANLLKYLQAEEEFEPTVAFLTPSFCHLLVKGRKRARPYRLTVLAGDSADEKTFTAYEQRHGCTVNLYGSTEMGAISAGSPDDQFAMRRDTAGKLLPGVRLASMDTTGQPGEQVPDHPFLLGLDHPYGYSGYAGEDGKPEKPSSLCDGIWHLTRDLARVDAEGRLRLLGRVDDCVKRDGLLVAFADVECALQRLPAIERALVVPGGTTTRGRELVAMCVLASGPSIDADMLCRSAREVLPGHAVPDRFVFVDELPLTATYKPDRWAAAAIVSLQPQ